MMISAKRFSDAVRALRWSMVAGCILWAAVANAANPTTWTVPGNFSTIQAAINAASSGDTILVGPGTYTQSLEFGGKNITLESTAGPASTIIHPSSGGCVDMGPGGALIGSRSPAASPIGVAA